jgi:hypothetical protein
MIQLYSGSLSCCSYSEIIDNIAFNYSFSLSNTIYSRSSESKLMNISTSETETKEINDSTSRTKIYNFSFSYSRSLKCS